MKNFTKTTKIRIKRATCKHAKAIGMIKSIYQNLVRILEVNVTTDQPQWDQYVNITALAQNTTFHASLNGSPFGMFHGSVFYSKLEAIFANPLSATDPSVDIPKMLDEVNEKHKEMPQCIPVAYHRNISRYDRKAQTQTLKINYYVFLSNMLSNDQSCKEHIKNFHWLGKYKFLKVLFSRNSIIGQIGTHRTHCLHHMRLRPSVPQNETPDINVTAKKSCILAKTLLKTLTHLELTFTELRKTIWRRGGDH